MPGANASASSMPGASALRRATTTTWIKGRKRSGDRQRTAANELPAVNLQVILRIVQIMGSLTYVLGGT